MRKLSPPFFILKPKPGTVAEKEILPGSGIVGVHYNDAGCHYPSWSSIPLYEVSYEGNRYGAVNLQKWEERVMHAADRLATGYPTIARGVFPEDQFEAVGVIDKRSGHWVITDAATGKETWL